MSEPISGARKTELGDARRPIPRPLDAEGRRPRAARERRLGNYQIVGRLGEGGMGTVYRAIDVRAGRTVALKVLEHSDPAAEARLAREAEALARVSHPGVVRVHGFEVSSGVSYVVEELIEGRSLHETLGGSPLEEEQVVELGLSLALALEACHAVGVFHRDLKPANVVVEESGQPRLVDFGLARLDDRSRLTQTGAFGGTLGYCPPEQVNGAACDARADVYGLGATLYECATGVPPGGHDVVAVMARLLNGELDGVRKLRPGLSPAFERVIARATARDRTERYQSAAALADALRALKDAPRRRPRRQLLAVATAGLAAAGVALALALRPAALPELTPLPLATSTPALTASVPAAASPLNSPAAEAAAAEALPTSVARLRKRAPKLAAEDLLSALEGMAKSNPEPDVLEALVISALNRGQARRGLRAAQTLAKLPGSESHGQFLLYQVHAAIGDVDQANRSLYQAAHGESSWAYLARRYLEPTSALPSEHRHGKPVFRAFAAYANALWVGEGGSAPLLRFVRSGPFADSGPIRLFIASQVLEEADGAEEPKALEDALALLTEASRLTHPTVLPGSRQLYARTFLSMNQPKSALKILGESDPSDAVVGGDRADHPAVLCALRGLALWRVGRRPEAERSWKRSCELGDDLILRTLPATHREEWERVTAIAKAAGVDVDEEDADAEGPHDPR